MNLMDDGGRWNIVDNTYNGSTWLRFSQYTHFAQLKHDQEKHKSVFLGTFWISPDDASIVRNIDRVSFINYSVIFNQVGVIQLFHFLEKKSFWRNLNFIKKVKGHITQPFTICIRLQL